MDGPAALVAEGRGANGGWAWGCASEASTFRGWRGAVFCGWRVSVGIFADSAGVGRIFLDPCRYKGYLARAWIIFRDRIRRTSKIKTPAFSSMKCGPG